MNSIFAQCAPAAPTAAIAIGTELKLVNGVAMKGKVIAHSGDRLIVEYIGDWSRSAFYAIDRRTMKDQDGDRWELILPTRKSYRNVYADGTVGRSTHSTEDACRTLSQYTKVRIGMIETTMRGNEVIETRMIATTPQKRTSAHPRGFNPYA